MFKCFHYLNFSSLYKKCKNMLGNRTRRMNNARDWIVVFRHFLRAVQMLLLSITPDTLEQLKNLSRMKWHEMNNMHALEMSKHGARKSINSIWYFPCLFYWSRVERLIKGGGEFEKLFASFPRDQSEVVKRVWTDFSTFLCKTFLCNHSLGS